MHWMDPWASFPFSLGSWLLKDRVGVGTERSGLSRRSGGGMGPMGVGEVAGADDTGEDSLLAGGETTDWPGHRRQRSWVLHSLGVGEPR